MKKYITFTFMVLTAVMLLSSCGSEQSPAALPGESEITATPEIIITTPPEPTTTTPPTTPEPTTTTPPQTTTTTVTTATTAPPITAAPESATTTTAQTTTIPVTTMVADTTATSPDDFEHQAAMGKIEITLYKGTSENVIIPGTMYGGIVVSIGGGAFKNNEKLESIIIPEGVSSIGDEAFFGCSGLTDITFPDSLRHIGWRAFQDCGFTGVLTLPDSLTSIENEAFFNCDELQSVIFKGVTYDLVRDSHYWVLPQEFYNAVNG